jgi:hypothetical protein
MARQFRAFVKNLNLKHWLRRKPIRPLLNVAELVFNRPSQTPNSESRSYLYGRVMLFVLLATSGTLLFEPALVSRLGKTGDPEFLNSFAPERWKIVLSEAVQVGGDDECEGSVVARTCPAHPGYVHSTATGLGRVQDGSSQVRPSSFWMIYDLSEEEAQKAERAGANILIADRIGGREKVYVNGNLMAAGGSRAERGIVSVTIPAVWLQKKLRVAIWVELDLQMSSSHEVASLIPRSVGLANSDNSRKLVRVTNFAEENLQLILAAFYFVLTAFFILLWSSAPQHKEPFVFALFCLVSGLLSARQSGSVYYALPAYRWYHLELFLYSAQGLAILWTGFAIARIRREISVSAGSLFISLYVYWATVSSTATDYYNASLVFSNYLLPAAYFSSALACFIQFYWVSYHIYSRHSYWLRRRQSVLGLYFVMFVYLFSLHLWHFSGPSRDARGVSFLQYGPVFVLLLVAYGLFWDLHMDSIKKDSEPLSRFHKMNPMPELVSGVLLAIDLKRSEALYRSGSYSQDQSMFVSPFVNSWLSTMREIGGDLIQFQGDEIMVLFETPDPTPGTLANLLQDISEALVRMDQLMIKIARELEQKTSVSITSEIGKPAFRATLSFGAIRPTLVGQGGYKIAGWMNADERQVLMRMSRLADAEKVVISSLSSASGYAGSTLSIDEETVPAETIEYCLGFFESYGKSYRRGIRTFLKNKGSVPPVLTLVYLDLDAKIDVESPQKVS